MHFTQRTYGLTTFVAKSVQTQVEIPDRLALDQTVRNGLSAHSLDLVVA